MPIQTRKLKLANGGAAIVDADFVPPPNGRGSPMRYYLHVSGYACRTTRRYIGLHQDAWERRHGRKVPDGFTVDHIDRNRLNNASDNLRLADRSLQGHNCGTAGFGEFRGVSLYNRGNYRAWRARVKRGTERRQKCFPFTDEGKLEAARWRDERAVELYGKDAVLNFPKRA
jgi:hypothetical protein